MKFVWFNLQPWPHLPDNFRKDYRSVWVDIPSHLFDPELAHEVYNTYLDQLEFADELGYDGIGCNEHHQNGYGLMPSPNIIAAALSRRTEPRGDLRDRQLDRRLQPADQGRRRVRDDRLHLRRASDRRLSRRHADGHQLLPRSDSRADARQIRRVARADHPGMDRTRTVRLRRSLHPVAARQHLAATDSTTTTPGVHPRRRVDRDLGFLPRSRLQLQLPVVQRLQGRQVADGRLLAAPGRARRPGRQPVPRRVSPRSSPSPTPTTRPSGCTPSTSCTSSTTACTCSPASPIRPGTARSRRSRPASSVSSARRRSNCSRS